MLFDQSSKFNHKDGKIDYHIIVGFDRIDCNNSAPAKALHLLVTQSYS